MRNWISEVESIRKRARIMLLAQRAAVILAWALGVLLFLGFADFLLRLPGTARLIQLVLLVGAFGWALWRYALPAIMFRPTLTDIALRVESFIPSLRGHLASGIEFSIAGADRESILAARAVNDAERRLQQSNLREIIRPKRTVTDLGASCGVMIIIVVIGLLAPSHAAIAARRIFIPFGEAQWPKRTGVESLVMSQVHPLGRALPLACNITRGFSDGMRVYAHYRVLGADGEARNGTGFERVLLTYQRDHVFERLIEPEGQAVEVWFETEDDRTPMQRVQLVPPPEIRQATLSIDPPAYAVGAVEPMQLDLGPGTDMRRGRIEPVLEGSNLQLTLRLNKPVRLIGGDRAWQELLGWEVDDFNGLTDEKVTIRPAELSSSTGPNRSLSTDENGVEDEGAAAWTLEWTMSSTVRMSPVLVDEYGIYGPDDVHYRMDMVEDHSPTVAITDPVSDRAVLPTAEIALAAEARDDVRIGELRMDAGVEKAGAGSAQTPVFESIIQQRGTERVESFETTLSLSDLDVEVAPGDVVQLEAVATDTFVLGARMHDPVRSTARRLRIISRAEFVEQVFQDLSAIRDRAIEIESDQNELRQRLESARENALANPDQSAGSIEPRDRRDQARISERIARQREQLQDIQARIGENRLEDQELLSTIARGLERAGEAGRSSEQAANDLAEAERQERARDESATPPQETAQQQALRERLQSSQEDVEQQLSELIDLLDRGEDAWGARRDIERLLEQQRVIEHRTQDHADQTRGRKMDELSDAERDRLNELTSQQQGLAQQSRELIDSLRNRARNAEETNPDLAQSMRDIARQAEQEELERQMEQASSELSQNQGSRAQASQQSAMNTLESMLDRLEDTERARLERLKRELASLLESIKGLIATQETELATLEAEMKNNGPYDGLDAGMIQLNRNTLSVADFAQQTDPNLDQVSDRLVDAAGAQQNAIVHLRAQPVSAEKAHGEEESSLALLQEALAMVEKLQQQNEQDLARQKRNDLRKAYKALFERQNAFVNRTRPFVADVEKKDQLNRRDRMEARQHANTQSEIQTAIAELLRETGELADAIVFRAGHDQIDQLAQHVVDSYRSGAVNSTILMREKQIADLLEALSIALEEDSPNESEFAEPGGAGGGAGGGGNGQGGEPPLIPPAAQLKLLRGLQESLYRSTRELGETPELNDQARSQRAEELGQSQQNVLNLANELLQQIQRGAGAPPPTNQPEPQPQGR